MPVQRQLPEYFRSISLELDVVKNRVRNIIGDTHWASDGAHKEAILMEVIRKFLPTKYEIGSGFIIDDDGYTSSRQIDILIYENTSPVFFRSPNFVILPRHYIRGIIEVKTDIFYKDKREEALENLYSAQQIVRKNNKSIYSCIFAFDYQKIETKKHWAIAKHLHKSISDFYQIKAFGDSSIFLRKYTLTSICINQHLYGLHWTNVPQEYEIEFGFYHTQQDSFNFFMSNLLSQLNDGDIGDLWYPSEKESRCLCFATKKCRVSRPFCAKHRQHRNL